MKLNWNLFLLLQTGSFDPHMLVLLAYALALADYFPEEVVREIFNVEFLAKLDAQLESMSVYSFQGSLLFVMNTIIQGIISSEM